MQRFPQQHFLMRHIPAQLILMLGFMCIVPTLSAQNLLGGSVKPTENKEWLSITEGLKTAAKEKKPLIVDFYTDWCGWCKVMDQKTYGDNRVKAITSKSFILAKYNPEKDAEFEFQGKKVKPTEFAKMMKVNGYPTTALFSSEGKYLESLGGYIEPNKFLDILNYLTNKKYDGIGGRTLDEHLILENIDRDPNNARYRLDLAEYYADSVNYKKSIEVFEYVASMKPTNPSDVFALHNGWGAMQFFYTKDFKSAINNFRKALQNPGVPQTKAVTMLRLAMAEAQDKQEKSAVESLQKFAKYCKENKLSTQGLRSTLEKSSELAALRTNKDFQQIISQLQ
jgi:thioredoxin-related protein